MSRANRPTASNPGPATQAAVAWRIRFVPTVDPATRVLRQFTDPAPAFAVAENLRLDELPDAPISPEPTDQLMVLHLPSPGASGIVGGNWLSPPAPAAPLPAALSLDDGRLRWRPGRVLVEGKGVALDALLPALAEFSYYEAQLRTLENQLTPIEASARDDVTRAYVPDTRDKIHWNRFRETIERLSLLRLDVARLEPRLYLAARDLPLPARRLVDRLRGRADVESRLEALSDRLEACEALYEGAVDRITDLRWYRRGMVVEIAIVILLFLEVLQLAASLWIHGFPGR